MHTEFKASSKAFCLVYFDLPPWAPMGAMGPMGPKGALGQCHRPPAGSVGRRPDSGRRAISESVLKFKTTSNHDCLTSKAHTLYVHVYRRLTAADGCSLLSFPRLH